MAANPCPCCFGVPRPSCLTCRGTDAVPCECASCGAPLAEREREDVCWGRPALCEACAEATRCSYCLVGVAVAIDGEDGSVQICERCLDAMREGGVAPRFYQGRAGSDEGDVPNRVEPREVKGAGTVRRDTASLGNGELLAPSASQASPAFSCAVAS